MSTDTQDAGNEMNTGIYLRAMKQIRSWSRVRDKEKLTNVSESEMARPWAGVAEWLRVAHSMLDEKAVELTRND